MGISDISLKEKFLMRQVVKVVAGLSNFNINNVINRVKAAEVAGATYVDIAANSSFVSLVTSLTSIPVCVSSINPRDLCKCVLAGASIVKIRNFDIFYSKKMYFFPKQVIKIAQETKNLLNHTSICITIPHNLLLEQQIELVVDLKAIGIECVWTKGFSTKNYIVNKKNSFVSDIIYTSSSTLSLIYAILNFIGIPIIMASRINTISTPIDISYRASGLGIGFILNSLKNVYKMNNWINEVIASISYLNNCIFSKTHLTTFKSRNTDSCNTKICFN